MDSHTGDLALAKDSESVDPTLIDVYSAQGAFMALATAKG